ncbi:hypothetical protein [Protaetiibacter intestinalis]|uniref:Helicase-associated domain-containing protein n=1 Tax=Protaetiibacter intestinalis TaxID=2419774 RepID=A0A387BFC0_9MICO|nr:hypothetical protein [Protaetiibacter intestinalis]AYF97190.1 hypothetical protein D7I47_02290 [Protaetiibacter intestinalis]
MNHDAFVRFWDAALTAVKEAGIELDLEGRRTKRAERSILFPHAYPAPVKRSAVAWVEALHRAESFVAENRRFPSRRSADAGERSVANWLYAQRSADLNAFQKQRLKQSPAFVSSVHDARWLVTAVELESWMLTARRLPQLNSADPVEFAYARWFGRAFEDCRAGRLDPRRAKLVLILLDAARQMACAA